MPALGALGGDGEVLTPRIGMRAIRKEQLQPRPAVRNLFDTLAHCFQAVPFRVVDNAPPLRDLVVIRVGDPNVALGNEPLDQLMSLRPPGPRDGPLAVGRPRAGGHCLPAATSDHRVVVDHQDPTIPQGIGRAPVTRHPGSTTFAGNEAVRLPVLPYKAEMHPSALLRVGSSRRSRSSPDRLHGRHSPRPGDHRPAQRHLRPTARPPDRPGRVRSGRSRMRPRTASGGAHRYASGPGSGRCRGHRHRPNLRPRPVRRIRRRPPAVPEVAPYSSLS